MGRMTLSMRNQVVSLSQSGYSISKIQEHLAVDRRNSVRSHYMLATKEVQNDRVSSGLPNWKATEETD